MTEAKNHQERKKEKVKAKFCLPSTKYQNTRTWKPKLWNSLDIFYFFHGYVLIRHTGKISRRPGMTSIKVLEQGRQGSGKSLQEEKWHNEVEDRSSIVKVLTGAGERAVRWKTARAKDREMDCERREGSVTKWSLRSARFSTEISWPLSIKLESREQYIKKVLTWENNVWETNKNKNPKEQKTNKNVKVYRIIHPV